MVNSEWFHSQPRSVCQCRQLSERRQKNHRATCWSACVITGQIPCCSKCCLSLLCCFSGNWKPEKWSLVFSGPIFFFFICMIWHCHLLFFVAFSFDQMESPFPLMWSSSQQTWWLGTQGVTMPASMSAGPTSPRPESLSLLLLNCMCPVGVMYCTVCNDRLDISESCFIEASFCHHLHLKSPCNWRSAGNAKTELY